MSSKSWKYYRVFTANRYLQQVDQPDWDGLKQNTLFLKEEEAFNFHNVTQQPS